MAFRDINSSIQRCLVKAIALHGLGLYVYAGEDLPQVSAPMAPPMAAAMPTALPEEDAANDGEMLLPGSAGQRPSLEPDRPPVRRPLARGERISRAQQTQIHKLALEVGISLERVLSYFCVSSLAEIAATDFLRVMRSLEKRRAA